MSFNIYYPRYFLLPYVLFAATVCVAIFGLEGRDWLLPILFLLLPFIDTQWSIPRVSFGRQSLLSWVILTLIISMLLFQHTEILNLFTVMVLVAALPEEWFFRAYLQKRLGNSIRAVLVVSLLFSLMHYLTHDSVALWLVFIPSVFFGWMYKKTDDLILIVIFHALSNLVYYIYLESYFTEFFWRI